MSKKILFIITQSNWGGAQRYVYDLASNLPREHFIPIVASGGRGPLFAKLANRDIKTIVIPNLDRTINPIKDIILISDILRLFLRERPDIIHLNSSKIGVAGGLASFLYKLVSFNFRISVVFTVHGWVFKEKRFLLARTVCFVASWFSCLFFNKVIVLDRADQIASKKFISDKKLFLIPNGIEKIDFFTREDAVKQINDITNGHLNGDISDNILLVNISELNKNKGLGFFIDAVTIVKKKLPTLRFKVIIIGEGRERRQLESRIGHLDIKNEICLPGFIPDAYRLLRAFDIFILSSLKEGLPYAVLEAMQAGIPVIASNVGGIPDIIENEKDGTLAEPGNTRELAKKIEELLTDPLKRRRLGENAMKKIENEFTFPRMLQNTILLYEQT